MDTEIAWAAGFFDGEGWLSFVTKRENDKIHYNLLMRIDQVDFRPLLRLQKIFGGVVKPRLTVHGGRRSVFTWAVTSMVAEKTLIQMLPYLINKFEQGELALKYRSFMHGPKGPRGYSVETLSTMAELRNEISRLKHKTWDKEWADFKEGEWTK